MKLPATDPAFTGLRDMNVEDRWYEIGKPLNKEAFWMT